VSRSRRNQLSRLWPTQRPQGADNGRRFRHRSCRSDRACAGRCGRRHRLSAAGRARCARGGADHSGCWPRGDRTSRGHSYRGVLSGSGGTGRVWVGRLGILVNNAGRQQSHDSILDISAEQFDWTLRTNLYAMFRITKAAIPHMPPSSAIINTSSVNAYDPSANLLDYAMTKAAIANFTKGLVKQMIKRRIRVNAVAPGPLLDGAASEWRADDRERSEVRPAGTDGAAGATSRNCACLPCNSRPRSRAM
jgi:NAD(P)-dependent dehydrogenase (short-subunit alcohol dehydrogenase family)